MLEELSAAFSKREETLAEISIIKAVIRSSVAQIEERKVEIGQRQTGLKYSLGRKKELENRLNLEEKAIMETINKH